MQTQLSRSGVTVALAYTAATAAGILTYITARVGLRLILAAGLAIYQDYSIFIDRPWLYVLWIATLPFLLPLVLVMALPPFLFVHEIARQLEINNIVYYLVAGIVVSLAVMLEFVVLSWIGEWSWRGWTGHLPANQKYINMAFREVGGFYMLNGAVSGVVFWWLSVRPIAQVRMHD